MYCFTIAFLNWKKKKIPYIKFAVLKQERPSSQGAKTAASWRAGCHQPCSSPQKDGKNSSLRELSWSKSKQQENVFFSWYIASFSFWGKVSWSSSSRASESTVESRSSPFSEFSVEVLLNFTLPIWSEYFFIWHLILPTQGNHQIEGTISLRKWSTMCWNTEMIWQHLCTRKKGWGWSTVCSHSWLWHKQPLLSLASYLISWYVSPFQPQRSVAKVHSLI